MSKELLRQSLDHARASVWACYGGKFPFFLFRCRGGGGGGWGIVLRDFRVLKLFCLDITLELGTPDVATDLRTKRGTER